MQAPEEKWLFISKWMAKNESKVRSFVYKRYYLRYSPYPIDDFVSEAHLVAYDALSICGDNPFEGYFWTLLKQKVCIAKAIGVTYVAVLKRFNGSIKRIEEARLSEEV